MCWWILAAGATVVDCGGEEVFATNAEGKGRREKCFTGGGGGSSGKELNLVLFFFGLDQFVLSYVYWLRLY